MDPNMRTIGSQEVQLWDRSRVALRAFWQQKTLVLVFLRHYG